MNTTSWRFYLSSDETWGAMLEDIRNAKTSIELEQFVFLADEIGQQFIDEFAKKAAAGVKVRMIADYVGSFSFINSAAMKKLKEAGIEIISYNPVKPWRLHNYSSWFFRDHRKILLIDNEIAYTGGVGIEKPMIGWRDTEVRLTGSVITEISYVFNRMWQIGNEGKFKRFRLDRFKENEFRFFTNSPHFRQRFYYKHLVRACRNAKESIYLTTPYFIPNQHLLFVLMRAARRGVDVRLVTPNHSDLRFVDMARNSFYTLVMKAGIRIYHYNDRVIHSKAVVIDDKWSSIGSANLDNISLLFNYEANLICTNIAFISELKDQFINDMLGSKELHLEDWQKRNWLVKLGELITWPFHSLL